jgi:omega-6 fatty acid desaturase (delta-12 desaturase)
MVFNPVIVATHTPRPQWYQDTAKYAKSSVRIAVRQLLTTLIPYFILFAVMVVMVRQGYSYWAVLLLAVPAAALFVRIFILFHDCTHGSFLPSPRWNARIGFVCGVLTFTAFYDWRRSHAGHHITVGDLDRRGIGDITTWTVEEYQTAKPLQRLYYRLYRSPLIIFGLGPAYYFLLRNRWPSKGAHRQDVHSVIATDLAILVIAAAACYALGWRTYLLAQLPVLLMAATFGVWLFYIQHQFEGVYWERHKEWDPWRAALEGASYYKMPAILQWLSGNIGFHHVHHARPGIPNYYLQQCYDETPELKKVHPVTVRSSLKSVGFNLWDEKRRKLVSFRSLKR